MAKEVECSEIAGGVFVFVDSKRGAFLEEVSADFKSF